MTQQREHLLLLLQHHRHLILLTHPRTSPTAVLPLHTPTSSQSLPSIGHPCARIPLHPAADFDLQRPNPSSAHTAAACRRRAAALESTPRGNAVPSRAHARSAFTQSVAPCCSAFVRSSVGVLSQLPGPTFSWLSIRSCVAECRQAARDHTRLFRRLDVHKLPRQ
jgi:hypothetical protein